MSCNDLDIDGIVEGTLARVGLDGLDVRDPIAVILALGWRLVPLPAGLTHGVLVEHERLVAMSFVGSVQRVTRTAAHEAGHVVQLEAGLRLPHDEVQTDRWGRAIVLGRAGLLRKMRHSGTATIVGDYADLLPGTDVAQRIWEVRQSLLQRTG